MTPLRTWVLQLLLQAADDAGVAVWEVLAEGADLPGTGALHGVLEVNVLRHAHLVVKHSSGALLLQAVAVLLHSGVGGAVLGCAVLELLLVALPPAALASV